MLYIIIILLWFIQTKIKKYIIHTFNYSRIDPIDTSIVDVFSLCVVGAVDYLIGDVFDSLLVAVYINIFIIML